MDEFAEDVEKWKNKKIQMNMNETPVVIENIK